MSRVREDAYAGYWEKAVNESVKRLRSALGFSQAELAERMSDLGFRWHQATVYKIETDDRKVTAAEAHALAEIFGVDLAALFDYDAAYRTPEARATMLAAQADRLAQAILQLDDVALRARATRDELSRGVRSNAELPVTSDGRTAREYYKPLVDFDLHEEILRRLRGEVFADPATRRLIQDLAGIADLAPLDETSE